MPCSLRLQYHVGQFTHNKSCRVCGREMFLQSRRDTPIAGTRDFFWACVGYYDSRRHCEHSESLNAADLNVFVRVSTIADTIRPPLRLVLDPGERTAIAGGSSYPRGLSSSATPTHVAGSLTVESILRSPS